VSRGGEYEDQSHHCHDAGQFRRSGNRHWLASQCQCPTATHHPSARAQHSAIAGSIAGRKTTESADPISARDRQDARRGAGPCSATRGAPVASGEGHGSGSGPCPNVCCSTRAASAPRCRAPRRISVRCWVGPVETVPVLADRTLPTPYPPDKMICPAAQRPPGSSSQRTPSWKEKDSNPRSPVSETALTRCPSDRYDISPRPQGADSLARGKRDTVRPASPSPRPGCRPAESATADGACRPGVSPRPAV
jgi:hypothetical protein